MLQMLLSPITNLIGQVIDKAVPDKNKALELKLEAAKAVSELDSKELQGAIDVILAEAKGDSWLQRNWRPVLMLWFAGLVGAHWLGFTPPNLPESVVNSLLDIVQVGVGGYVLGRTGEKMLKTWKS